MIPDRKAVVAAKVLIKEYGTDARELVVQRTRKYQKAGDNEGAGICQRILWAVDELTRLHRTEQEILH